MQPCCDFLNVINPCYLITVTQVPISGVYDLVRVDDNYKDYLLAMDIPHTAVDILAIS